MPRAGLSRDAVVALALEVVDAAGPRGFEDLTLAAVAAKAGVAVPSLYKHVAGLPDLRREVARSALDDLAARLGAVAGPSAADASTRRGAALHALAREVRAFAHEHPGRYAATQGASWARDADAADVEASASRSTDVVAAHVAALGVPAQRTVDAVRAFRAAVHGFVVLELAGGFGLPDDVDASFEYLVGTLVTALGHPAGDAPA